MASSSTQIPSSSFSSSSFTTRLTYEVFLSFYGKDTRNSFTDHLYAALLRKGINVFRDNEKLKCGENISQELLKAIEGSRHAVIVISENYAVSKWCLAELTKIMECRTQTQMIVLPVFYHVNPSDVRNQKRTFEEAFAQHMEAAEVDKGQMEAWRATLKEVSDLRGWHIYNRSEARVVEEICAKILHELNCNISNISKRYVGMKSRVKKLKTLLCLGCLDVRCMGIYGMSGIGKTTLVKLIYDTTFLEFEASCFLAEDGQVWKHGEVEVIDNKFFRKKVLIVIDDVDGKKHLGVLEKLEEALTDENSNWFGPGSRIILTSGDRQLIKRYVGCDLEVKELNDEEALELFSLKAFKKPFPQKDYLELSKDIVRYAEGFRLAIEVFGSFFFCKSMDAWRSSRKWLEVNLNAGILKKLKISFDGLEDTPKQLFLDIACFFYGRSSDWLRHILESFGYFPEINIQVLMDKSLIKIKDGKFWMHNLLVQMGRQIVKDEIYKYGRLWHHEDIIDVLKNNISTDAIEGIRLLVHDGDEVELNLEAFSKMHRLRMIEIIPKGLDFEDYFLEEPPKNPSPRDIISWTKNWPWSINPFKVILKDSYPLEFMPKRFEHYLGKLQWVGDHSKFKLSDKLCLINWFQYPLHSLPDTFQSKKLVELRLPCSHVKNLWRGSKNFGKLRVIHLKYSINLVETPDLTNVPNLEKLELSYCTSLSKVHPSIGSLKQLKLLDLSGCKSLKNLPKNLGGMESLEELNISQTATKQLPSIGSLKQLKLLNLSGCKSLKNLPKDLGGMETLEELNISQTSLEQLPSSIGYLKKLKVLKGGGTFLNPISFQFSKSFSSLRSLTSLVLQYCNLSDGMIPNDLDSFSSLEVLCLDGNKFKKVPEFIWKLSELKDLSLSYCNISDGEIPNDISNLSLLEKLCLKGNKFTTISNNVSQLPCLDLLNLSDNSKLQALPKLPCSLFQIDRSNCLSLNTSSMDKWGSSVQIWKYPFGVSYYGYGGKSHKTIYMALESTSSLNKWIVVDLACGPTLGSEIPEWFEIRSNGPYEIQARWTIGEIWSLWRLALFIVYEVHESSNYRGSDDTNPDFLEIAYQIGRSKRISRFVEVHPFGRTGLERGRNGVWVLILNGQSIDDGGPQDIIVSVSTNSPNIEVKEYGIHGANPAIEDLFQVLDDISGHQWPLESFEKFYSRAWRGCPIASILF